MSDFVSSRIERTSLPWKSDIRPHIRRSNLKNARRHRGERTAPPRRRPAPTSRLRILPPQLGDVRGQDHDPALERHPVGAEGFEAVRWAPVADAAARSVRPGGGGHSLSWTSEYGA